MGGFADEVQHLEGWVTLDVLIQKLGLTKASVHHMLFRPGPGRENWVNIKDDLRKIEHSGGNGKLWYLIRPATIDRIVKLYAEEQAAAEASRNADTWRAEETRKEMARRKLRRQRAQQEEAARSS